MTLSEKFHHLEWKGIAWSVSGWACSCPTCSKECVCTNNVLLEMVFNRDMTVPEERETALPSVRKGRMMARGLAGDKRKRVMAAIAAEKSAGVKKSRLMDIEGPSGKKVNALAVEVRPASPPLSPPLSITPPPPAQEGDTGTGKAGKAIKEKAPAPGRGRLSLSQPAVEARRDSLRERPSSSQPDRRR